LPHVTPARVLRLGLILVAASAVAIGLAPAYSIFVDDVQQLVATGAATVALLLAARTGSVERRFVARTLAVACIFVGIGMFLWDVQPGGWTGGAGPGDLFFAACVVTIGIAMAGAIFGGLDRSRLLAVALDTSILLIASGTLLTLIWDRVLDANTDYNSAATALGTGLVAVAGPTAAYFALLHRRVLPSLHGPHVALAGVTLVGLSMVGWETLVAHGLGYAVGPTDYLYSIGLLATGYGGATWDMKTSSAPRFTRYAQAATDLFPMVAVGLCVSFVLLAPGNDDFGVERLGTAVVVILALVRQVFLTTAERRARVAEGYVSGKLEREIRSREMVLRSLSRLEGASTPEETARLLCEEALRLDGIDHAAVRAFGASGEAVVMGLAGVGIHVIERGMVLSAERSLLIAERSVAGPWTETFLPDGEPHLVALYDAGLRMMANAPLVWNDQIIGVIGVGSTSSATGSVTAERLRTVREFGVVAGALLGPHLADRARREALHASMSKVIADLAFHPVFQPIVDLESGRTIGYEALTRFDDGVRPDLQFANAAAADLGLSLETACLRAAQRDSVALPGNAWLSLNVSPALASALLPLIAVLELSEREVVLEVTEHAPIDSYAGLSDALTGLRGHVRIAVDDAGAGYAGLQHILEIRPDIVKLDISLVRDLDTDPVRRALISGMVSFARDAGFVLLAEGIETESELVALRALGVSLGQGYLLGRPARIESIVEEQAAA
jgi:EAL domain-containing protein (putative c-di-GMP-specific phosphodiesterase class I)